MLEASQSYSYDHFRDCEFCTLVIHGCRTDDDDDDNGYNKYLFSVILCCSGLLSQLVSFFILLATFCGASLGQAGSPEEPLVIVV